MKEVPFPDYVQEAFRKQGKPIPKHGPPRKGEGMIEYMNRIIEETIESLESLLTPEAKETYDRSLPGIFEQVGLNPDGTPKEKM